MLRHAADTLSVVDTSRCDQLTSAPRAGDVAALTRLHRLALPARTCRCDVINFRSVVDELRSRRQRPRPSLFCAGPGPRPRPGRSPSPVPRPSPGSRPSLLCGDAAVDLDAICSDGSSSPTAVAKPPPAPANRPRDGAGADEPLPYNPMLGWYTAAVLSGLLFAFIACVGLEKAEKHLLDWCTARHDGADADKKHLDHLDHDEHWTSSRHHHQQHQQYQCFKTTTRTSTTGIISGITIVIIIIIIIIRDAKVSRPVWSQNQQNFVLCLGLEGLGSVSRPRFWSARQSGGRNCQSRSVSRPKVWSWSRSDSRSFGLV